MARTEEPKPHDISADMLTTMAHTSKMLGMAAALYFLTSFELFSSFAYILIIPTIVLQAYRDNGDAVSSILAGITWLLEVILRHDVRAQLTTYLDKSFKIMDMFVLMIVFSHSPLGSWIFEYCKLRWRLCLYNWRKSSGITDRWMNMVEKIPFLRALVLSSSSGQVLAAELSELETTLMCKDPCRKRENGLMNFLFKRGGDLKVRLLDLNIRESQAANQVQKASKDESCERLNAIDTRGYSTSPALMQVQSYTNLGDRQHLKTVSYQGALQLPSTWQSQWPTALHMVALLTYGRLLSCLPQMSCMKLRILVAGSLLFANEFEIAFNNGHYVPRHAQVRQFCFGSLTSSFCVVAAMMLPFGSIGLGLGMTFIPCSTFVVAIWTCLVERRRFLAGDRLGSARRFGAMVFAALAALYLKVMDARTMHSGLETDGIDLRMLTGFRPGM